MTSKSQIEVSEVEVRFLADLYKIQADGTVLRYVASRGRLRFGGYWRRVISESIARMVKSKAALERTDLYLEVTP